MQHPAGEPPFFRVESKLGYLDWYPVKGSLKGPKLGTFKNIKTQNQLEVCLGRLAEQSKEAARTAYEARNAGKSKAKASENTASEKRAAKAAAEKGARARLQRLQGHSTVSFYVVCIFNVFFVLHSLYLEEHSSRHH